MKIFAFAIFLLGAALLPNTSIGAADGLLRFDFETGDLQGWRVVEGKFDRLVSDRAEYHNGGPYTSKQGRWYLSTVEQQPGLPSNDRMTGIVESPVFVLAGPEMSLLVGGGDYPEAYVALCTLDGKEMLHARGKQTEVMHRVRWIAPQLVGQKVFLRVTDHATRGWGHVTFDDFSGQGRIDSEATSRRWAEVNHQAARRKLEDALKGFSASALRAAISDLSASFGDRYPRGQEFLARLDQLENRIPAPGSIPAEAADRIARLAADLESLQREALLANPLVSRHPIVFVVRHQYRSHYHAIDTLFHTGELNADRGMTPHCNLFEAGGALKTLDLARGGRVTTLIETRKGIIRDPEVHYSGRKIVFALRTSAAEDYHLYEIEANGTGLRQLTRATGVSDFDPFYLPDDSIAFSSTREPKYNMCSRDHGANLFRMASDGANIHQISKNNLFDSLGTLMPDGRILYCRWEYVDRNFGDAHGVWTVNPDGTNQAVYWGNNTASPGAVYYPRIIPGTDRMVCVFGMHHMRLWGAMAVVDRRLGIDGRPGVVRTWPADAINRVRAGGGFDCDGFADVYPKYESPWPLSDKYFLCSRMTMRPGQTRLAGDARSGEEMGIYLVDVFGNEVLLHVEEPGCYDPVPLAERPREPALPSKRDFEQKEGQFFVADVYQGTHVQGVRRGTVKRLRVVESPEKRHWSPGAWFGQGYTAPGMNWHSLENKRILGTTPVEADGSAYFSVPAEKFVYFQLLDEHGMMIQSMRSGAVVQSGERIGCVGCHEERRWAPPSPGQPVPLALRRASSKLESWRGAPREFSFMAEVQPVFTHHCVGCHDYGKEAGTKLNLAPDRTLTFNTAYTELWRNGLMACIGAGPAEIQPAYAWGSHASRLVRELRDPRIAEHKDLRLSPEDLDRIITWIDLNGVYYPTYACAYPDSLTGRIPLDRAQLGRLAQLTGVPFAEQRSHGANGGPEVSFDRPELSPCLSRLDRHGPAYREALSIIRAGSETLARRPRADMPGFIPSLPDQRREAKYAVRREIEMKNRAAIRTGGKVYDE